MHPWTNDSTAPSKLSAISGTKKITEDARWLASCTQGAWIELTQRAALKPRRMLPMTLMTAMDLPTLCGLLLFTYCGIRTVSFRRMLLARQSLRQR
jgi:hypothetical protein